VHIVAHGQPGEVRFSAGALTLQNLRAYTPQLREIGRALDCEGRLQLWACQTAYGVRGATFLAALECATGARVAASTTPIGAESRGGRWELDAVGGRSEVQPPLAPAAVASYAGLMALRTWRGTASTSRPNSGSWSRSSSWSPTGVPVTGDSVLIGGSSTYTLSMNVAATPNLNSVTISDGGATLAVGTSTLNVAGTSSTAINVTAGHITIAGGKISDAGGLALGSSASLKGSGTVAALLSGGGTVTASGGVLDLTGTVSSGLTLAINSAVASDLKIDGTATATTIAINSANQTLEIGATGSLTINASESVTSGHIQLDGGSLTDPSGMTLGGGATLSGKGTVSAPLSGGGTITASGGILEFQSAVDSSTASTFKIANVAGADLQFDGTVGTASIHPTISFNGANGLLDLSHTSLGNFQGIIANFASGDGIDVAGATGATLDSTGTILTVSGNSGTLGTITLGASYTGDTFSVTNNIISVSPASPPPPPAPPPPPPPPPSSPTLSVANVISGPSDSNNATLNGYYAIPPDNALAASASAIVMAENDVIEITSLSGTVIQAPESLSTFFAPVVGSNNFLTDPRALFDATSGRFIVTTDALTTNAAGAVTGSAVLYAISSTAGPTGWTYGQVNTTYGINGTTTWADQPTIASNGTDLYVTTAQFGVRSGQYVANAVTIIPLSGGAVTAFNLGSLADYRPAAVPGGSYFVGYTGDSLSILYNSNGSSNFTSSSISLGSIDVGSGIYTAAQKGTSVLLDAGDNSVASTVVAGNYLYAVFEVVPPGGTQPAVHWVKIDLTNNTVAAQGNIAGPGGAAAFNPSIAVDGNGDALVNYTVSSSTMDPAAYASVMPAGSSSFLSPVLYGSSVAPETATFGVTNNVIRWGDYSSAVADPAAANSFVVSNEVVPSAQSNFNNAPWGTVTAVITVSPGTSSAVIASSSTTTSSTSSNAVGTSTIQLAHLTANASAEFHGWDAFASTVAALDATNMPSFAPVPGLTKDSNQTFTQLVQQMARFGDGSGAGETGGGSSLNGQNSTDFFAGATQH
ncbi:MAG: DUF4347 domain-containing protein, partial [Terriglobales bacterium]